MKLTVGVKFLVGSRDIRVSIKIINMQIHDANMKTTKIFSCTAEKRKNHNTEAKRTE